MSVLDRRRMLLSLSKIGKLIIFDKALQAGSVISSSYSEISSGYINVKGGAVETENTVGYSGDVYSSMNEVLESLGSQRDYVVRTYTQTSGGHTTYYVVFKRTALRSGYLELGSYDFSKYKTLKFSITNYKASGSVSFGDEKEAIASAGTYSIDIKDRKGNYNIKFSSDSVNGYSVNNIYLEG